jgi:hypothetical protein
VPYKPGWIDVEKEVGVEKGTPVLEAALKQE